MHTNARSLTHKYTWSDIAPTSKYSKSITHTQSCTHNAPKHQLTSTHITRISQTTTPAGTAFSSKEEHTSLFCCTPHPLPPYLDSRHPRERDVCAALEHLHSHLHQHAHDHPHDADSWSALARLHMARGNARMAAVFYRKALRVYSASSGDMGVGSLVCVCVYICVYVCVCVCAFVLLEGIAGMCCW